MRRAVIGATLLAVSTVVLTADATDVGSVDPVRLAERDIAAGRFRALCVFQGFGCGIPGIGTRNYLRCYPTAEPAKMSAWFGDVIVGDEDLRARRRAVEFASQYNTTLARALETRGERWCPAGEDWDAIATSVEIALSRNDPEIPGWPYLDVSRDAAPGHYFRVVTDYAAWVNASAQSSICDRIARHGVRHRLSVAIGARGEAPPSADRFACEAGQLVPYTARP